MLGILKGTLHVYYKSKDRVILKFSYGCEICDSKFRSMMTGSMDLLATINTFDISLRANT